MFIRTALLLVVAGAMAFAAAAADVARGALLFEVRCAICHAGNQSTIADAVRVASGRPETIRAAIANIGAMNYLATAFTEADLEAIAAYLASREAATRRLAIEFRHEGFGHYFVSANQDEVAALDARRGPLEPWRRTSLAYAVDIEAAPGRLPVCRFFSTSFAPKSSHFYTLDAAECEAVRRNPDWVDEGIAFHARPAVDGACPTGSSPLYRLYNGGRGGAPNHRFVTDANARDAMIAGGFVPEGPGGGIAMCVPP